MTLLTWLLKERPHSQIFFNGVLRNGLKEAHAEEIIHKLEFVSIQHGLYA